MTEENKTIVAILALLVFIGIVMISNRYFNSIKYADFVSWCKELNGETIEFPIDSGNYVCWNRQTNEVF